MGLLSIEKAHVLYVCEDDGPDVGRFSVFLEKMAQYLICVLATLGILVFLGIITSGTSVAASVALFSAVAGACVAAVVTLNQSEKQAAIITLPVER